MVFNWKYLRLVQYWYIIDIQYKQYWLVIELFLLFPYVSFIKALGILKNVVIWNITYQNPKKKKKRLRKEPYIFTVLNWCSAIKQLFFTNPLMTENTQKKKHGFLRLSFTNVESFCVFLFFFRISVMLIHCVHCVYIHCVHILHLAKVIKISKLHKLCTTSKILLDIYLPVKILWYFLIKIQLIIKKWLLDENIKNE